MDSIEAAEVAAVEDLVAVVVVAGALAAVSNKDLQLKLSKLPLSHMHVKEISSPWLTDSVFRYLQE